MFSCLVSGVSHWQERSIEVLSAALVRTEDDGASEASEIPT